jgi:hypothetical protein
MAYVYLTENKQSLIPYCTSFKRTNIFYKYNVSYKTQVTSNWAHS